MNDRTTSTNPIDNDAAAVAIEPAEPSKPDLRLKRMIKRFGVAGFLFFFIKGVVLYILIPLGLFKWLGGC